MDTGLEHLSKQELIDYVAKRELDIRKRDRVTREKDAYASQLLALIDRFKGMAFAQTRERFEGNKDQMALPFGTDGSAQQKQEDQFGQKIVYTIRRVHGKSFSLYWPESGFASAAA